MTFNIHALGPQEFLNCIAINNCGGADSPADRAWLSGSADSAAFSEDANVASNPKLWLSQVAESTTALMILLDDSNLVEPRMVLIPEKIGIPSERPRTSRERLMLLLESSLASRSATIVSGRAGTGKTALATAFARACARPVAWYKVDASDFDLRVFLQYLIASVARQRPEFGEWTLVALAKQSDPDGSAVAEWIVHELLEPNVGPLLIVLEDLHLICESTWLVPFLCRVLPLLPRNVHMLITSRTMPPAPLWRMRSKQTLDVIDEARLAFTRQEAMELFAAYGISREQADRACDQSHGRAAALIACANTLRQASSECVVR